VDWARDLRRQELLPLRALVAAVLERAFQDLKLTRDLADPAREWLEERDPLRPWSFEWCCAILHLDPDAVREQLAGDN
jgi:hypothetical protein